jgi:hypothetical protein
VEVLNDPPPLFEVLPPVLPLLAAGALGVSIGGEGGGSPEVTVACVEQEKLAMGEGWFDETTGYSLAGAV